MSASTVDVVEVPGGVLEIAVAGSGPGVVLIASLGRSAIVDFRELAASLATSGFTAISVEARGVGRSVVPSAAVDLHDLAADVAAVCEALHSGPVHVVGHALGNRIARCLASDRPDLVRTVTLLAAGGAMHGDGEARTALHECFNAALDHAAHVAAVATAFFAPDNDPAVWIDGWYADVAAKQAALVRRTDLATWWSSYGRPTLIIQGLDDRVAPPANGRALRDALVNAGTRIRLIELEGAGHALLPEAPDEIAEHIIRFLEEQS